MKITNLIFLLTVIIIYSGLNYFLIYKTTSLLPATLKPLFYTLVVILFFLPFITIFLLKIGLYHLSKSIIFISHLYLIFLFLFLSFSILLSLINIFLNLNNRTFTYFLTLITTLIFIIYGYFETDRIKEKTIEIKTSKIKKHNIKIMHISDLHFSIIRGKDLAFKIKKTYDKIKPDIVLFTGDLIDSYNHEINEIIDILKNINPPLGKYSVLGNHEYYYGIDKSIELHKKAGFEILRNKSIELEELEIIGIDEINSHNIIFKNSNKYTILLKHRPYPENTEFDLQLSGHTHGGQIFPFTLLVSLYYKYPSGLHKISSNKLIYVHKGTGTWGPIRIFATPEIVIIKIIKND